MGDLSIGEAARRAGLSASAIRYYERRNLLPEPPRRSGRRCYDPAIVARLRTIAAARRAGLPIREIRALLSAASSRSGLGIALADTLARLDGRIEALERLRRRLGEAAMCDCAEPLACDFAQGIEPDGPWRYRVR